MSVDFDGCNEEPYSRLLTFKERSPGKNELSLLVFCGNVVPDIGHFDVVDVIVTSVTTNRYTELAFLIEFIQRIEICATVIYRREHILVTGIFIPEIVNVQRIAVIERHVFPFGFFSGLERNFRIVAVDRNLYGKFVVCFIESIPSGRSSERIHRLRVSVTA